MDIGPLQSSIGCSGDTAVPKPEWGTKRTCQSCSAKFYDLAHSPIVCPKCETTFEVETKTRKSRGPRPVEVIAKPVVVVKVDDEIEVDDVEVVDDDGRRPTTTTTTI